MPLQQLLFCALTARADQSSSESRRTSSCFFMQRLASADWYTFIGFLSDFEPSCLFHLGMSLDYGIICCFSGVQHTSDTKPLWEKNNLNHFRKFGSNNRFRKIIVYLQGIRPVCAPLNGVKTTVYFKILHQLVQNIII